MRFNRNTSTFQIILALMFLLSLPLPVRAEASASNKQLFNQANRYYQQGDYSRAVTAYQQILNTGNESGNLYFNLGNAYYRLGQSGRAILYYEKARRLLPHDPDLLANLNFVWSKLTSGQTGSSRSFDSWLTQLLPLDTGLAVTSGAFFLLVGLVIVILLMPNRERSRSKWYRTGALSLATIVFGLSLTVTIATLNLQNRNIAIAVTDGAVRYEPSQNATVFYQLPPGSQVEILERKSGWLKVQRPDRKQGWIEAQTVTKI